MPAPLSVVVPTLDAGDALPGCLAALIEGLQAGLIRELVVSDGGSTDATRQIADAAGAIWVDGPAGRGGQIARGVRAASAPWVLILHADSRLDPGWSDAVAAHVASRPEKAGYFRLRFRAEGAAPRLVAGWANFRSRAFGLPYGDQGLLARTSLLASVGGVPEHPLMEDVALSRALKGRLVQMHATSATSAARYEAEGWARRGARNLLILARYSLGADPEKLARSYQVRPARPD